MTLAESDNQRPDEFEAGGSSPPTPSIPPQLAEELAEIIADALVADYSAKLSKTLYVPDPEVPSTAAHAETQLIEETM